MATVFYSQLENDHPVNYCSFLLKKLRRQSYILGFISRGKIIGFTNSMMATLGCYLNYVLNQLKLNQMGTHYLYSQ